MFHEFLSAPVQEPQSQDGIYRITRQAKNTAKSSFCLICNAEARFVNYGALSCYSCKIFFRRHSFRIKVCFFLINIISNESYVLS